MLIRCTAAACQGFEKTGLGERIANKLLTLCGSSTLGLATGLAAADTLIATAMPSTTARGAGIFVPVITSLSKADSSFPGGAPLHKRLASVRVRTACRPSLRSQQVSDMLLRLPLLLLLLLLR